MKNLTLVALLAFALVACGKKDESASGTADPVEGKEGAKPAGDDPKPPSGFDCGTLLTDAEVEKACGAKGTVKKLGDEGTTKTVGSAKMLHVCYRDIAFESGAHVTLAINFVSGGQTAEDMVRGSMDTAGKAGWGKKIDMTGYVGMPPSTDPATESLELRGLLRGTMIELTTSHKTGEAWACNEDGLKALAKVLIDRVPAAPSR
jgi:hypothetical protein